MRLLARAFEEADRLGHRWVGVEHLLLAVLRSDSPEDEAARAALEECGVSSVVFAAALVGRTRDEPIPANDAVSATPRAYTVMGRADGFALAAGHDAASANELLVAILWEQRSLASATLADLGVSVPSVVEVLARHGVWVPELAPPTE